MLVTRALSRTGRSKAPGRAFSAPADTYRGRGGAILRQGGNLPKFGTGLQHHETRALLRQVPGYGQPGMAALDHDDVQ
jgi:hypothetical protein